MSVEWFDLGARLYAARVGRCVPKLRAAPVVASPHVVAVHASVGRDRVSVTLLPEGGQPVTATGTKALDALGEAGIRVDAPTPTTLAVDGPGTVAALAALCARPGRRDDVAGHIGWWLDRADFPSGRAVVNVTRACQTRGVPDPPPPDEGGPGGWREWLGVTDRGIDGVRALYRRVTAGPVLPGLALLAEDDVFAWQAAQKSYANGWDWRRPDTPARAAVGLRGRCDAADLYEAALLDDPLWQARAVHTGHVVVGTLHTLPGKIKRAEVRSTRQDTRLRPGKRITGHGGGPGAPGPVFSGTIETAEVHGGAALVLTITGVTGTPPNGTVTLHESGPSAWSQRSARATYAGLYRRRSSWLSTGRFPPVMRRDVPLAVLVAAADPEDPA